MTARAYCERHFATYAASGPCPDCEAMAIEARAKAAAAPKATHEVTTPWTKLTEFVGGPDRFVVTKPLLAMVPRRPLSVDECQPQLRKLIEACKRKTGKVPDSIAAPGGFVESEMRWMEVAPGAFSVLSDNAGKFKSHTIKLYAAERRWRVGVDGGATFLNGLGLDESAWEDAGWQPRREPRREYSFPSHPAAPSGLAAWLPDGADVEADAKRLIESAKRDMDAALARLRDNMYREPPPGTGKAWAEVLSEWAPSTKARESFFGVDWGPKPAEPCWHIVSHPSDHEAAKQFADNVRAHRWWEVLPPALPLKMPVIEDPTCPPGFAYLVAPPSGHVDALHYAYPAALPKIKLPEDC